VQQRQEVVVIQKHFMRCLLERHVNVCENKKKRSQYFTLLSFSRKSAKLDKKKTRMTQAGAKILKPRHTEALDL